MSVLMCVRVCAMRVYMGNMCIRGADPDVSRLLVGGSLSLSLSFFSSRRKRGTMYAILNKSRLVVRQHLYLHLIATRRESEGESCTPPLFPPYRTILSHRVRESTARQRRQLARNGAASRLMTFRHAKLFNLSSLLGQFRCMTGYSKTVSIYKRVSNR